MENHCKNCEAEVSGNFCSNCGQTAHTHPINFHYLWHDIQHGVFHFDKGLFYTINQLFTRPGHTIREFMIGKRAGHFKPVALVFLLGTVYGLIYHYFDIQAPINAPKEEDILKNLNEWLATHYALVTLIAIPFESIGTRLAFYRNKYNLVEHFVLNSFVAGQKLVVSLAILPLLIFFNNTDTVNFLIFSTIPISFGLTFWTYRQFFREDSAMKVFFKTILSYVYFSICMILLAIIGALVYILMYGWKTL